MSRKGSSNGEYDSSVADKIMKQLQKDSEELTLSLEGFINTRGHAIYSQKLALAAYDDEIAAIVDTESDEKYVIQADEAAVDHNVMRHLNANKEVNGTNFIIDEEMEIEEEPRQISSSSGRRKKKPVLKPEPKVLDMDQKRSVREKMFQLLDESRINEMRLELEYENAKENDDPERARILEEELFDLQIRNSECLLDVITDYNPSASGKNWGNDPDYLKMLKHLATLSAKK